MNQPPLPPPNGKTRITRRKPRGYLKGRCTSGKLSVRLIRKITNSMVISLSGLYPGLLTTYLTYNAPLSNSTLFQPARGVCLPVLPLSRTPPPQTAKTLGFKWEPMGASPLSGLQHPHAHIMSMGQKPVPPVNINQSPLK